MDLWGSLPSKLVMFGWELIFGRCKMRRGLAIFEFFEIGFMHGVFFGRTFGMLEKGIKDESGITRMLGSQ